jgi:hypothetical protein
MKIVQSIKSTITRFNAYGEEILSYHSSESGFDKNGNLVSSVLFNESGEIDSKSLFELNNEGKILAQIHYERRNDLIERTDFFDTEDEVQYKTEVTSKDGTKTIHEYRYNQLGNTDQITIKNEDDSIEAIEIFKFNDDGILIEEIRTNGSYEQQFKKKLSYNNKGQVAQEEFLDDANRLQREVVYHYNENNLLIEKVDKNLEWGSVTNHKYSYDSLGNQILDETFQNGVISFKNHCKYDDQNNLIEERIIQIGLENFIDVVHHNITYSF